MSAFGKPYPKGTQSGYWGPVTSHYNFCEEDYVITPYIGEFVNTFTNLVYVIYGAYGIRRALRQPDGGIFSTLAFPYWGLVAVGVLSAWFHATLKYHSQMGDDLSMLIAVGANLHQLLAFEQPLARRRTITGALLAILIPVSVYHCWADEHTVHVITFGIMVFISGRKTRALIRERVKNPKSRKRLGELATLGTYSGLFGYFLWNIDFHLCHYVTAAKRSVGLPLGLFLELHGWWHIFTGIGSYIGMALVEYLVTLKEAKTDRVEEGFVWPVKAVLRDLEGTENGKKGQ